MLGLIEKTYPSGPLPPRQRDAAYRVNRGRVTLGYVFVQGIGSDLEVEHWVLTSNDQPTTALVAECLDYPHTLASFLDAMRRLQGPGGASFAYRRVEIHKYDSLPD